MFRSLRWNSPWRIHYTATRFTSTLRDYQHDCISSILTELKIAKFNSLATSIATGGGKTVIFCSMIPQLLQLTNGYSGQKGIVILVHRTELAFQTIDTLKRFKIVDDDRIYLDMAGSKLENGQIDQTDSKPFVIVASIQSLSSKSCKRMSNYPFENIHTIIIDECHHAVSNSYLAVLDKFKSSSTHPPFILGFSATLTRHDKLPLNKVFQKIVYQKPIHELIDENYLCDVKWEKCNVGLNLNEIEVSTGKNSDYLLDSLADHVINDKINNIVLKTFIKLRGDHPEETKSVLAFCINIEHMQILKQIFNEYGIPAECVSAQTSSSDRQEILKRFKAGEIRILFNCSVFTEGTDIPNIDCIFMLRPTLSKPLLTQMVGRGLRLHTGKSHLKIIDFVDNQSLGLSFKGTLAGKSEPLIAGTGGLGGSGVNSHDKELPGEAEYIKLTDLKGIQDLLNDSKTTPINEARRNIAALNKRMELPFELIRYNLWVCILHSNTWYEIKISKNGLYKLESVTKFDSMRMGKRIVFDKKSTIIETKDFDELEEAFKNSVTSQETFKSLAKLQISQQLRMSTLKITQPQMKHLNEKIKKILRNQGKAALSVDKASDMVDTVIHSMNRWEASKLISQSIIGGKQVFELWLHRTIFNTVKKREKLTSEAFLESQRAKQETGWDQ